MRKRQDLAPGEVQPQRTELGDELVVAAGRVGLTFERAQLAAHLAQQVLQAQQVASVASSRRSAFSLRVRYLRMPAASSMIARRSSGRALSTASSWPCADDHVLLAADAGVGEQLLDVEQPARHAVDRVLAVAGAEQRAA